MTSSSEQPDTWAGRPTGELTTDVPSEVDITVPSASRMYDYYLGGSHHFPADRHAADKILRFAPWTRDKAGANRAFLRRVVTYLVRDAGIRQILDLGSGVPTVGNVHQVAHAFAPDTRVVYVDVDPVAVAHSRLILADNPHAVAARANILHPQTILTHPDVRSLLDTGRPTALLMIAALPFVTDADRPDQLIAAYLDALAPGSYLAISHVSSDGLSPDLYATLREAARGYAEGREPVTLRPAAQIRSWFDGLDLVDPGIVPVTDWRPDSNTDTPVFPLLSYGGVGRLP
jgi:trans-aconitate methyltransferase